MTTFNYAFFENGRLTDKSVAELASLDDKQVYDLTGYFAKEQEKKGRRINGLTKPELVDLLQSSAQQIGSGSIRIVGEAA